MFDETRFRQILREEIAHALAATRAEPPGDRMTPAQAATFCQVTPATLRNWRKAGLKCETLGKVVRYTRLELEAFMGRKTALSPAACVDSLLRE